MVARQVERIARRDALHVHAKKCSAALRGLRLRRGLLVLVLLLEDDGERLVRLRELELLVRLALEELRELALLNVSRMRISTPLRTAAPV